MERWLGGNAWQSGASEGENVRLPGETEERNHDEVDESSRTGVGSRTDNTAFDGPGGSKERAAETGAKPIPGGAGAVERNWEETDRHCRRPAGRQVCLQTAPGFDDVSRSPA